MIGKIKEIEIRYYSNNLREKNDWCSIEIKAWPSQLLHHIF